MNTLEQTILQLAVTGKLVAQNSTELPASKSLELIAAKRKQSSKSIKSASEASAPFDLPTGWSWTKLPDIGELSRGKSKHRPRNDPALFSNGTYPLIQTGDVARAKGWIKTYSSSYNKRGLEQSRLWPKGTMCITIAANIADTALLGFEACFPDSVVGFLPFENIFEVRYFDFFIKTAKTHLESFAPATAQKNINLDILSNICVPLPPAAETRRIVAKVDELIALCDALKAHLAQANTLHEQLADALVKQSCD
ncbi:MAG: restriction endonuclease subunit S [Alphaproteobacteria bacterium]|nr:restriction endonuclease subunit S [Alphaproteobacteria bacterium]